MKNLLLIISILALLLGCEKKGGVLVSFKGGEITVEEFNKEIENVPEFARGIFEGPEGKRRFLDDLINRELVYIEAKRRNIERDKEYIKRVEKFKKEALLEMVLKREIEDKARVEDPELKAYYDSHPEEFRLNEELRVSHILVKTEAESRGVMKKLEEGADFEELARKLSQDPGSAKRGGDLGYFGRGKMIPEFEKTAFGLKKGELGGPVKTEFGYHIIKLTGRRSGQMVEFAKISDVLRQRLIREKQKEVFERWLEGIRKGADIKINEEILKSLEKESPRPILPAK